MWIVMWVALGGVARAEDAPSEGDLPTAIRNAVRVYGSDRVACFARASRRTPGLAGAVDLRLTVEGDRVVASEVAEDGVGSDVLTRCLQRRIRRWRIPWEGGAGTWTVRLPFEA
jgi:hypothetical protein